MRSYLSGGLLVVFGLAFTLTSCAQHAPDVPTVYRGRDIFMQDRLEPGGAYDVYARAVARFIGNHNPGHPTLVPKNQEGAGSLRLANWLYNIAPKDGSEIGTIGRGLAFDPLLGNRDAEFDPLKFMCLGSANNEVSVCVAWSASGITRLPCTRDQ